MRIRASAPGTLMLFGEHAVLHGRTALVCAADRRIHVSLSPRADDAVRVESALGTYVSSMDTLGDDPGLRFVLEAVRSMREALPGGFEVQIASEFSHTVGLGSSAAVTAATLSVLDQWCGGTSTPQEMIVSARAVIRKVQGTGSGADAAASVLGGVVRYRMDPLEAVRVADTLPLTVVYSGSKTPTAEVIRHVDARRARDPAGFAILFDRIGDCAERAAEAIAKGDWPAAGEMMKDAQELMVSVGVSNAALDGIVASLRDDPGIHGAKISGSGLGDCVIGLGEWTGGLTGERLDVSVSPTGLTTDT